MYGVCICKSNARESHMKSNRQTCPIWVVAIAPDGTAATGYAHPEVTTASTGAGTPARGAVSGLDRLLGRMPPASGLADALWLRSLTGGKR